MKTLKILFTVMAAAIVAIATAVEKPRMDVTPITADRAVVSISNEKPAYFELSVTAGNGDVVYYKQSSKALSNYQKIFDFENLENGSYILSLKINDTKLSRNLEVASSEIKVGESELRFDPYFSFSDNVLKFSYLNFDQEKFRLSIFDDSGLVYQSVLGNELTMTSGYDLSKLEAGHYEVVLSSFENKFSFSVEK